MPIASSGRNLLADGLAGGVTHIGVHDGVPSDVGSLEVAGTTRQAVTWTAAAGGIRDNVGSVSFTMPASTGVTHVGLWSASTAGTFRGSAGLNGARNVGTVDAADVAADTITSPGHGLANTNTFSLRAMFAGSLPAGLTADAQRFVVGSTTDTFQSSTTSGGSAENITGVGRLFWESYAREFGAAGWTLTFNAGAIDLDMNMV
jgi:hypothetical protein